MEDIFIFIGGMVRVFVKFLILFFVIDLYSAKYASVDLQLTIKTVKDGIRATGKLEKEFKKKQKEIKKLEKEIEKMTNEFRQKAKYLSPEKQQTQQQAIQQKMLKYRELVTKANMDMQKRQVELTKPIIDSVRKVIEEIAKKGNYDLVYEKQQSGIFYAKDAEDITNKVIKRYNEIHK